MKGLQVVQNKRRTDTALASGKFRQGLREVERTKGIKMKEGKRYVGNVISSRRKVWLSFIRIIPCVQPS
jgi:hypothetical protein